MNHCSKIKNEFFCSLRSKQVGPHPPFPNRKQLACEIKCFSPNSSLSIMKCIVQKQWTIIWLVNLWASFRSNIFWHIWSYVDYFMKVYLRRDLHVSLRTKTRRLIMLFVWASSQNFNLCNNLVYNQISVSFNRWVFSTVNVSMLTWMKHAWKTL